MENNNVESKENAVNENETVIQMDTELSEKDLKNQEQIREKLNEASPKEILETYLKDPNVIENLKLSASYLDKIFRSNWFTTEQVLKKTVYKNQDEFFGILNLLILSHLVSTKIEKGVQKFKITLTKQDKLKIVDSNIIAYEKQLLIWKAEKELLLQEIEKEGNGINLKIVN